MELIDKIKQANGIIDTINNQDPFYFYDNVNNMDNCDHVILYIALMDIVKEIGRIKPESLKELKKVTRYY